jgi:hypothetical protein
MDTRRLVYSAATDDPVFVVGCGRSGTTMLRLMLDSHPSLAIPGESNYVRYRWADRRAYWSHGRFMPERLLEDVVADPNILRWGIAPRDIRTHVNALDAPTFADVVAAPFKVYAKMRGKPRWGDKTPIYVLSISTLAHLFPSGKFVHLIRDGRDVALSYLSFPMFHGTIWNASWRWREWVSAGIRAGRSLGPKRYLELKYEDLVAHPEDELRVVCGFLDLPFDERMLTYYRDARERLQSPTGHISFHTRVFLPPQASSRDWRKQMSREDLTVFESVAGSLLEELGYARGIEYLPLPARGHEITRTTIHWMHVRASRAKKAVARIVTTPIRYAFNETRP